MRPLLAPPKDRRICCGFPACSATGCLLWNHSLNTGTIWRNRGLTWKAQTCASLSLPMTAVGAANHWPAPTRTSGSQGVRQNLTQNSELVMRIHHFTMWIQWSLRYTFVYIQINKHIHIHNSIPSRYRRYSISVAEAAEDCVSSVHDCDVKLKDERNKLSFHTLSHIVTPCQANQDLSIQLTAEVGDCDLYVWG